jgi:hypothetical protein
MAKNKGNKNVENSVVETTKVKTGETTDLGFIKALKAKGIDAKAMYPAETLRDQLNSIDDKDVSFLSTNEVVLDVINGGEGPTPVEEVTVIVSVEGLDEGDNASGTIGEEVITSFPAEITRRKGTTETLEVTCEHYVTVTQDVTFDEDKEITVTLEREEVTMTIEVDGIEEGDQPTGTLGEEVLDVFPAQVTRDSGTTETLTVSCDGYKTVTQDVTFDIVSEGTLTVTLEKEETNEEPADGE